MLTELDITTSSGSELHMLTTRKLKKFANGCSTTLVVGSFAVPGVGLLVCRSVHRDVARSERCAVIVPAYTQPRGRAAVAPA